MWMPNKADRVRVSLADQVYSTLKEAIFSLDLPVGSALVESELAKAMGTSVTPVREALRRLQSEGLVTVSYARHVVVRGLSLGEIKDLYQVRALLEHWAVRESILSFDENDYQKLEDNIRASEEALKNGDLIGFSMKNAEFHRELVEKCKNQYVLSILDTIAKQHNRIRIAMAKQMHYLVQESSNDALAEHWRILRALQERDADRASEYVRADICELLTHIEAGRLDELTLILNVTESDN